MRETRSATVRGFREVKSSTRLPLADKALVMMMILALTDTHVGLVLNQETTMAFASTQEARKFISETVGDIAAGEVLGVEEPEGRTAYLRVSVKGAAEDGTDGEVHLYSSAVADFGIMQKRKAKNKNDKQAATKFVIADVIAGRKEGTTFTRIRFTDEIKDIEGVVKANGDKFFVFHPKEMPDRPAKTDTAAASTEPTNSTANDDIKF